MPSTARPDRIPLVPATLGLLAFGTLAVGGVYPWGYWPFIGGGLLLGAAGFTVGQPAADRRAKPMMLAAAAVLLGIGAQLVPVPSGLIRALSSARDAFLTDFDVRYAAGLQAWRPLSVAPAATWLGLLFAAWLFVVFFGLARALGRGGVRTLAAGLIVLALVVALVGIVSRAFPSGRVYGVWEPTFAARPFGSFVNRNHFAGWMFMALSLSLGYLGAGISRAMMGVKPGWRNYALWWSSPQANRLILVAVACAIMALSLVLTLSRSGITCFVLSMLLTGWFVARRGMAGSRKVAIWLYLVGLIVTIVGWAGVDTIARRFGETDWSTVNERLGAWGDAASVIRDFGLVGAGWNSYGTTTLLYQTVDLERHHFAEAHNDYLQAMAEGGLLVVVPLAIFGGLVAGAVRRRFRDGDDDTYTRWLRGGAVTALVAMLLQETVEFSLQIPANALLFAVMAAIAVHAPAAGSGERRRASGSSSGSKANPV